MYIKYSKPIFNDNYGMYHFLDYYHDAVYCDSRCIADIIAKPHQYVLNCIHKLLNGLADNDFYTRSGIDKIRDDFIKETYLDENGENQLMFLISSFGALCLFEVIDTMPWKGSILKDLYNSKKEELFTRFRAAQTYVSILRNVDEEYPEFSDAVRESEEDYDKEIDMLYEIATKESVSNIRLKYNIPEDEHQNLIRCYLTEEQILEFRKLQRADIGLLLSIPDIEKRREILKEKCTWSNHTERDICYRNR